MTFLGRPMLPEDHDRLGSVKCPACGKRIRVGQRYVEQDGAISHASCAMKYCGVKLVGGWCKREAGHEGDHACS